MRRTVFSSDRQKVLLIGVAGFVVITTCLPWFFVVKLSSEQAQLSLEHNHLQVGMSTLASGQVLSSIKRSNETDSLIYHFVVNSDCSAYQRWQVLTQIHSARAVKQVGHYTWIVSGCPLPHERGSDYELTRSQIIQDLKEHFPSFSSEDLLIPNVHFSPDFSNMSVYGGPYADGTKKRTFLNRQGHEQLSNYGNHYHFNNKPNGLRHWAEEHYSDSLQEEALVLIDPDFLFLTPFQLSDASRPFPGKPVAAAYGLGSQWLDFNRTAICGHKSPCTRVTDARPYSVGPPYIIHAHDVLKLSQQWSNFVPPTYDQYPLLYAEMYAYSMAAAHLEMPHNLLTNVFSGCMVGWPKTTTTTTSNPPGPSARAFVDSGADRIKPVWDGPASCFLPPLVPPPFLHYCRRYAFENPNGTFYFLAKRKIPHDILDCAAHDYLTL
jgi:hypothetical protein